MPSTTAKGSVVRVASDPITKAVRTLFRALKNASLPVASVPSTCQEGHQNTRSAVMRIVACHTRMAGRQGLSEAVTHRNASVYAPPLTSFTKAASTNQKSPRKSAAVITPAAVFLMNLSRMPEVSISGEAPFRR